MFDRGLILTSQAIRRQLAQRAERVDVRSVVSQIHGAAHAPLLDDRSDRDAFIDGNRRT